MNKILFLVSFLCIISVGAASYSKTCTPEECNRCISSALNDLQSIKVGMTRQDLLNVFTASSGFFNANTPNRAYVYRRCHYIVVDVEFAPSDTSNTTADNPKDIIKAISRPYLSEPKYD